MIDRKKRNTLPCTSIILNIPSVVQWDPVSVLLWLERRRRRVKDTKSISGASGEFQVLDWKTHRNADTSGSKTKIFYNRYLSFPLSTARSIQPVLYSL